MMVYSFACPFPCDNEILVAARNDEEAVTRIIMDGAIRCRNGAKHCYCKKANRSLEPMSETQLRDIVRLCMRAEDARVGLTRHSLRNEMRL
jgi:hypothetical protein